MNLLKEAIIAKHSEMEWTLDNTIGERYLKSEVEDNFICCERSMDIPPFIVD
jgi:hypothetical protein